MLDFRSNPQILAYVNGAEVARYAQQGVVTPDHTIRTKNLPAHRAGAECGRALWLSRRRAQAATKISSRPITPISSATTTGRDPAKRELDPLPRVALVPGLGLFGMGRSKKDAAIAADIAENTVLTITDAEAIGLFEALSEGELV